MDPFYQQGAINQWGGNPRTGAKIVSIDVATSTFMLDMGGGVTIRARPSFAPDFVAFQIEQSDRQGANCAWKVMAASIVDYEAGDLVSVTAKSEDVLRGKVAGVAEVLGIWAMQ